MKNILILGGIALLLLAGGALWSRSLSASDSNLVARSGLHWHPRLQIYVKGERQEIPANIGLGAVHMPMHTHAEDSAQGVIHLEFADRVMKDDLKLGNFFKNWNRDMRSFGTNMHMTVNGVENMEYENYMMQDGDNIELHYE